MPCLVRTVVSIEPFSVLETRAQCICDQQNSDNSTIQHNP